MYQLTREQNTPMILPLVLILYNILKTYVRSHFTTLRVLGGSLFRLQFVPLTMRESYNI